MNVSIGTISNYENEEHEPSIETLCKLADYFNISIDYLVGRIKFNFDYSIMNKPLNDKITFSNLLNDILSLRKSDILLVVDYVNLLKFRDKSELTK